MGQTRFWDFGVWTAMGLGDLGSELRWRLLTPASYRQYLDTHYDVEEVNSLSSNPFCGQTTTAHLPTTS